MSAFTAGQKLTAAALNNAIPGKISAKGNGGGNHTTTSGTFADIHASMYDCAVPAVAGDKLDIALSCQYFHSVATKLMQVRFTVAGVAISDMPTEGLAIACPDTNRQYDVFEWTYVVQSGDISGGLVTVRPQFATDAATLSIRNNGTNGRPLMVVRNMRQ